jgi:hypothetical protein
MPSGSRSGEAITAPHPVCLPYRWVVLGVAFLAFFITFMDRLAWANDRFRSVHLTPQVQSD